MLMAPVVVPPAPLLPGMPQLGIEGFLSNLAQMSPSEGGRRHPLAGVKSAKNQTVEEGLPQSRASMDPSEETRADEKGLLSSELDQAISARKVSRPSALLPSKRFTVPVSRSDTQVFLEKTKPTSWNDFVLKLSRYKRVLLLEGGEEGTILPLTGNRLELLRKEFGNEVDPQSQLPTLATLMRRLGSSIALYDDAIGMTLNRNIVPLKEARKSGSIGSTLGEKPLFHVQMDQVLHYLFGDRASLYPRSEAAQLDAPQAYEQLSLRVMSAIQENGKRSDPRDKSFAGQLLHAVLGDLDRVWLSSVVAAMTSPKGDVFDTNLLNVSAMGLNTEEVGSLYGLTLTRAKDVLGHARAAFQERLRGIPRKSFPEFELGSHEEIPLKPEVRAEVSNGDQWLNGEQVRGRGRTETPTAFLSNPDYFGEKFSNVKMYRIQPNGELRMTRTFSAAQYDALLKFARMAAEGRHDTKGSTVKVMLSLMAPLGELVGLDDHLVSLSNMFRAAFGNEEKLLGILAGFFQEAGTRTGIGTSPQFERELSDALEKGSRRMSLTTGEFIHRVGKIKTEPQRYSRVNEVKTDFNQDFATAVASKTSIAGLREIFRNESDINDALEMLKAYDSDLYDIFTTYQTNPTRETKLKLGAKYDVGETSIINKLNQGLDRFKAYLQQLASRPEHHPISPTMQNKITLASSLTELKQVIGLSVPSGEGEELPSLQLVERRVLAERYDAAVKALENDADMKQSWAELIAYDEARQRGEAPRLTLQIWEALHFIQQKLTEPPGQPNLQRS
jgi:hypothetical protein